MDYSNLYEIRSIKEVDVDPKTGDITSGVQLNEPLVNSYEAGTTFHVFPYANKVLVVSKSLEVSLEKLLTEVIGPDEALELQVGMNKWDALNRFAEVIAEIENFSTPDELENMDGWVECKAVAEQAADTIMVYSKDELVNLYNNMKAINWARGTQLETVPEAEAEGDNIQMTEVEEEVGVEEKEEEEEAEEEEETDEEEKEEEEVVESV
jgi:hypothetical protein